MTALPIRIVLVETSHPGNIGAAARAMKNMGLTDLVLVRPREFPSEEASARASGADDVLASATVYPSLVEAIAGCGLVAGTSARARHLPWQRVEPGALAARVVEAARANRVAIVFGSERVGLTNEELMLCNLLVTIPTDTAYSSLNVAMAVQLIAYEIFLAARDPEATPHPVPAALSAAAPAPDVPLATADEMQRLYQHLEDVLDLVDFRDRTGGGHLMTRIRRLFNRAQLDQNELNILRGILTAVEAKRRPAGAGQTGGGQRGGSLA